MCIYNYIYITRYACAYPDSSFRCQNAPISASRSRATFGRLASRTAAAALDLHSGAGAGGKRLDAGPWLERARVL